MFPIDSDKNSRFPDFIFVSSLLMKMLISRIVGECNNLRAGIVTQFNDKSPEPVCISTSICSTLAIYMLYFCLIPISELQHQF